ncbi:hypothetical protein IZU99_03170 [Oscillospiraceae bacterium CM]|nr:hypothetical protein IZU99_03170 [Oscillospiraceae bacterium CM]
MKIRGNPGPDRITVTFEEGKFMGKSITMNAEPLVGGVALYAKTIKGWDGSEYLEIDAKTKKEVITLIRQELKRYPPSEIVE